MASSSYTEDADLLKVAPESFCLTNSNKFSNKDKLHGSVWHGPSSVVRY